MLQKHITTIDTVVASLFKVNLGTRNSWRGGEYIVGVATLVLCNQQMIYEHHRDTNRSWFIAGAGGVVTAL